MMYLFFGLLIGLLLSAVYLLARACDWTDLFWLDAAVCGALVVSTCLCFCGLEREASRVFIAEYQATKCTVEAALENTDLPGGALFELLQTATEANKELTRTQYYAQQWYGFNIDKDVLLLEPILLEQTTTDERSAKE